MKWKPFFFPFHPPPHERNGGFSRSLSVSRPRSSKSRRRKEGRRMDAPINRHEIYRGGGFHGPPPPHPPPPHPPHPPPQEWPPPPQERPDMRRREKSDRPRRKRMTLQDSITEENQQGGGKHFLLRERKGFLSVRF